MSNPGEFEGDEVTGFFLQIPSTRLEVAEPYVRGTHLDLKVRVRVKSVLLEPNKDDSVSRRHTSVMEGYEIVGVETPEMIRLAGEEALRVQEEAQARREEELRNYNIEEHPHPDDAVRQPIGIELGQRQSGWSWERIDAYQDERATREYEANSTWSPTTPTDRYEGQ